MSDDIPVLGDVPLLGDVVEQFAESCRAGESPSVLETVGRYPHLRDELAEILPTIIALHEFKDAESAERELLSGAGQPSMNMPQRIGEYDLVRELGRGGMGVVYEAIQASLGRRVALKVLASGVLATEKQVRRFRREASAAGRLHHTNIVPVFGVGESEGTHFYVMQLITGVSLERIIDVMTKTASAGGVVESQLDPSDRAYWRSVARIGVQTADAIHYAHLNGVLHRDIKPANLLLDAAGTVWVTDFGLAKLIEHDDVSKSGAASGTLRYMAPEQLSGDTDPRSDIYSLGLTLFELLTLQPACDSKTFRGILDQKLHQSFSRPRDVNPDIPRDLETIVLKSLSPERSNRYETADQLGDDLRRFLEDRPILARRASVVEQVGRWCRRNRAVAFWSGLALLLLLMLPVALSFGYMRESRQRAKAEAHADIAVEAMDEVFQSLIPSYGFEPGRITQSSLADDEIEQIATATLSKEKAELLSKLIGFYDRLATESSDNPRLQLEAAKARHRVGDIHQRMGQYQKAILAYEEAINRYQSLNDENTVIELEIARVLNEMGSVVERRRGTERASPFHEQAITRLTSSDEGSQDEGSQDPSTRYELARSFFLHATSRQDRGAERSRRASVSRSAPNGRSSRTRRPDEPSLRVAGPNPRRGGLSSQQETALHRAIEILDTLVKNDSETPGYQFLLARCYRGLASRGAFSDDGTSHRAVSARILRGLIDQYPHVAVYRFELSETYREVDTREPRQTRAFEQMEIARELSEQLVDQHPNVAQYAIGLAHIHSNLGRLYLGQREFVEAEKHQRLAIESHLRVVSKFPGLAPISTGLAAGSERALTRLLLDQGQSEQAMTVANRSVTRLEDLIAAGGIGVERLHELRKNLADANELLLSAVHDAGDTTEQAGAGIRN